jgi:5-histidylcysteine sulfoxide synthase
MVNLGRPNAWPKGTRFCGTEPTPGYAGVKTDGRIESMALPNLRTATRAQLREYFDNGWLLNEVLFSGLSCEEAFYRPPYHHLRHPMIFYLGHTSCTMINKLTLGGLVPSIDPYLESIFEVGVDEMSWDDMGKNDMVWPTLNETMAYKNKAYKVVADLIDTHPSLDGTQLIDWNHPMWALVMAFEHDRIHLETSSVLMREMPLRLLERPAAFPLEHETAFLPNVHPPVAGRDYPANPMLHVEAGTSTLGKPRDFPTYGWDNEYGHRELAVPAFEASKFMITNGEMWEFVAAGGYQTEKYWCEQGWGARRYNNQQWPAFWEKDGPSGSNK